MPLKTHNNEQCSVLDHEQVKEEEDAITTYKEQLISQIDELFQRKIQYDISQLRERIHQVQTGI